MENVFSPAAGHQPQNRHSSVDFEPPSAEQLKQNSLVLFLCRNQALCALCKILAVVCRSTGECVRPAAGLRVLRVCVSMRERAMCGWYAGRVLGYGVLIAGCLTAAFWCSASGSGFGVFHCVCTLSLCLFVSPFFSVFSFIHSFRLSSLSPFCFFLTKFFGYTSEFLSAVVYSCGFHFCAETCPQQLLFY